MPYIADIPKTSFALEQIVTVEHNQNVSPLNFGFTQFFYSPKLFPTIQCSSTTYVTRNKKQNSRAASQKAATSPLGSIFRDYNAPLSQEEKEAINYITDTLANTNMLLLLPKKESLENAGGVIKKVHPFVLLLTLFEKHKDRLNVILNRSIVGNSFIEGIAKSCTREYNSQNISDRIVEDFAKKLGLNSAILLNFVKNNKWEEMINFINKSLNEI